MTESKNKTYADQKFSIAYQEMNFEIDRVTGKKFHLWNKFTMWIYSVIFGDKYHLKSKQTEYEKLESVSAFEEIKEIFEPEKEDSMTEEEIFSHSRRKFRK
ncbi:MAG TPA: hypothetical protein PL048_00105 [Leptospiraceae bacterium]|nr:hypothetical protein [Leptospiraceae bacterium]HMY66677.1 hypothetical protein [Leptospiraceae bacterium]HMZ57145.1 hypothetical protein [Leptospiraceae bacterium]HNF15348.1 hypothetical protein [Leptospiraceae bacterium]HNF24004.1 hypothetical protein [Leptospiraceae bacterium]